MVSNLKTHNQRLSKHPGRLWALIFLLAGIGLFWTLTIRDGHGWGGDFSLYIHHARNLLAGIPYGDTGYILNPTDPILSPQTYPPIFPLMLVPVLYVFGFNLTALKMVVIVCFLLFLAVFIALAKRDLPFPYLFALILTLGFNPYLWNFKDDIRSDVPFLLFTYMALNLVYQHDFERGQQGRQDIFPAFITGLFCYLAYGTRTIGFVLPAVIVLFDILKRRKITRFTLIVLIIFVFSAGLQTITFPSTSYWEQYIFDPMTYVENIASYLISLSTLWDNGYNKVILRVLSIILLALAFTAFWARLRSQMTVLELYVIVYVIVLVVWPVSQGIRFLIPVLPLLFFYIFWGLWRLGLKVSPKGEKRLLWGVTAVILISYVAKYTTMPFHTIPTGVSQPESVALFEYIKANTNEADVIIFRKPRVLSLYTDRPSAIFHPESQTPHEQWEFWRQIDVKYVIVSSWDEPHWQQFIAENQSYLQNVYTNPDFRVYRIEHYPNE